MRTIEVNIHGDKANARSVMLHIWKENAERLLHQYPEDIQKKILHSTQTETE